MEKLAIFGGERTVKDAPKELFAWPIITEEDEAANAPQTGGLPETNEAHEVALLIQLGLLHQGGAYTFGQTVENEYGSAALVDRVGSTVSLRVTLLQDQSFSIGSATSGVWRLTVNGEKAEKFPTRRGPTRSSLISATIKRLILFT